MPTHVDTIVIGAGQAGLSASNLLTERGIDHVVLERGQVANTWRNARWDGFYLNTPNWTFQLPGHEYDGPEPDAFFSRDEVVEHLEAYARGGPVRTGVEVTRLRRDGGVWSVETEGGELRADAVVVATGAFQRPHVLAAAEHIPDGVFGLVADGYRNPDQLPQGAVLIVGSGQTGCQIADELRRAGRRVYLAVGSCPRFPRRWRGRDLMFWMLALGILDDTPDSLPSPAARLACTPAVAGDDGGHDCHPRWLAERGVELVGRFTGFDGGRALFAPGLEATLAAGDDFHRKLLELFEEHARENGLDDEDAEPEVEYPPARDVEELDLQAHGITSIVWATGYRPDFRWIEGLALDAQGFPIQSRGVAELEGLYFVGLHWLSKRKSALLIGVGEDARHVVEQIASRR
jgi:putative flavoprotein involved in K+ transport